MLRLRVRPWRRWVLLVLGTMALGAVLAVVKGRDYGLGYFIGNLSTPYLLSPFLVGRAVNGRVAAGTAGVVMTWVTLGAFYVSAELAFGYPSGSMTRFYAEWFLAGALSGTAMGLLGRESRERAWLRYALPLALLLEPFAVLTVQSVGRFGGLHPNLLQLTAWSVEIVLGCALLVVMRLKRHRARRARVASTWHTVDDDHDVEHSSTLPRHELSVERGRPSSLSSRLLGLSEAGAVPCCGTMRSEDQGGASKMDRPT